MRERLLGPADGPPPYIVTRDQGGPTIAVVLAATAAVIDPFDGDFFARRRILRTSPLVRVTPVC